MSAGMRCDLVSVQEYLAQETASPTKREFVGGRIYPVRDEHNRHNLLASNLLGELGIRLKGKRCRAYGSQTKIRLRLPTHFCFYYPDACVVYRSNAPHEYFQDEPAVLFEVTSRSTRRIDEGEKKDAYLTIPSLSVYVLAEQESPAIVVFRRTEHGFRREVYEGLAAVLDLSEIDIVLPLAELYDGVEFVPEPEEEDA